MWRITLALVLGACNDDLVLPPPGGGGDEDRIDTILALSPDLADGEAAFTRTCAPCHDPAGAEDRVGPALAAWVQAEDARATVNVIVNGQGIMPAQNLDDQAVADVVGWMTDQWASGPPDGAALFDEHCTLCHLTDGPDAAGPYLAPIVPERTPEQLMTTIEEGIGVMPAFQGTLSAGEIAAVVTWLQTYYAP